MKEPSDATEYWLPTDLLSTIFSQLPLADLIRSTAVCKQWRESAAECYGRRPQLPWVCRDGDSRFYSLNDCCYYDMKLPDLLRNGFYNLSTYEDWMVVVIRKELVDKEDNLICFINSFSHVLMELPLPNIPNVESIYCFSISAAPSSSCFNCALTFTDDNDKFQLRVCSVRGPAVNETQWISIPIDDIFDLMFYGQSLYNITENGVLQVLDKHLSKFNDLLPPPSDPSNLDETSFDMRLYKLMIISGDLLMICFGVQANLFKLVPIAVYMENFELATWVAVESLNGRGVLLPNSGPALSMAPNESLGIEGDCLYFPRMSDAMFDSLRISDKKWIENCFGREGLSPIWSSFFGESESLLV